MDEARWHDKRKGSNQSGKGCDRRSEAVKGSFSSGHDLIKWPSSDPIKPKPKRNRKKSELYT